jgi:FkbM family methyltransferase
VHFQLGNPDSVLPALNNLIKKRLPGAHAGVRNALRWWLIESRSGVDDCPAIPRKVGGEWMWLHPRFLTEPLDLEPDVQAKFREFIRQGDTVLDIGAYVGTHTVLAAKLTGPGGRVFAFEPSPSNFQYLAYHCRRNSRHASAFQSLVSDRAGERLPFHLLNDGDSTSNSMTFDESIGAATRTIEVESVTVDGFCAEHNARPAFIKIDVEGAESMVLRGAARVLHECRPTIILALHPQWLPGGVTPESIRQFLGEAGYDVTTLDGQPAKDLKLAEYVCRPRA